MKLTTCSSCGASIFYALTVNKKRMPMDAQPVGKASVLKVDPDGSDVPVVKIVDAYQTHFISCPQAQQHRKPAAPATSKEPTS